MALPNLGAHTDGGTITVGQTNKETTSNNLDALLDNSQNQTTSFVTTAGGTLSLATPQANLDQYLDSGLIRLTGSPAGAFTVDLPDGDRRIAFKNESGQAVTIDTVSGATPTVAIPDGTTKTLHVYGIEIEITADDATQTGALLADGTVVATGAFDWDDNVLAKAEIRDYAETHNTSTPASSVTLDLTTGNVFELEMDQDTTLVFSNPPASGKAGSFTLILKQNAGAGHTVTWPTEVDWESGTAPTLSNAANQVDILSFLTVDGGISVWYGFTGGVNFG